MTTQDIYFGIQTGLQLLVGGGVVWGAVWLSGVLQRALESQEKTIAAQAEQLKAQSTVLQDFTHLTETMKRAVELFSDPAALQREEAYRARVERDANAIVAQQAKELEEKGIRVVSEVRNAYNNLLHDFAGLAGHMLPFVPLDKRRTLIGATGLSSDIKQVLRNLEASAPPVPSTFGALFGEHPSPEWWQRRAEDHGDQVEQPENQGPPAT